MADSGADHARATLEAMVRDGELPGAQYLAVTADGTLLELHVGRADVEGPRPMELGTLQMAYSITKVITAVAVMQLVDRGALELDRPLSDYVREQPFGNAITIRMLLAHTAGVPNPMPLDWFGIEGEPLDRDAALREVLRRSAKLSAPPGARYGYTNVGYWLLEPAIEAASGRDYAEYVREEVFAPVGVAPEEATFELPPHEGFATGHSRRWHPMNAVLFAMTPSRYWARPRGAFSRSARLVPHGRAYGGLYCSAAALAPVLSDLLRATPRLLSPAARDAMLAEQRTTDGEGTSNALGWALASLERAPYAGKQGGGFGFHGNVRVYRGLGLATVLLANRTEISPGPIDARSDALDLGFVRERRRRSR